MSDEDADIITITAEEMQSEPAFLVGQAFAIIKRVRGGETGPKLDHAMDRFLADCLLYHRKLYGDDTSR